ncbi:MAG: SUMF1/EgtB/PvdO family nonheme iron enzyme [Ignavibacteriales bacterium]|nr:SUMF1/EgtB/PvdO family nonheme iron enzyme [Ignavibacteriales bacterium]
MFQIQPTDAILLIDGKDQGTSRTILLAAGEHIVKVSKGGYRPEEKTINVSSSEVYFSFTLQAGKVAAVTIRSVPSGAQVFINGVLKGETDTDLLLSPGAYTVKISKSGYVDVEKAITIRETGNSPLLATLEKNSGTLELVLNPPDATVLLNDIDYTGKCLLTLQPGLYAAIIRKTGYASVSDKIEIIRGKTVKRSYNLEKSIGVVELSVSPADARVLINKNDYTGKSSVELPAGRYKIEVQKTGFYDQSETVEIVHGGRIRKEFKLSAKSGTLRFSAAPVEAKAQLLRNGSIVYSWEGEKVQKGIPVGEYELSVSASGYAAQRISIRIEENKTTLEEIVLKKIVKKDYPSGTTSSLAGEFVFVKGGTFKMGSNESDDEKPIHSVAVSDFYIGKYEVTQKQWRMVMGNNPSNFRGDNLPVERVSWNDVQEFIKRLNEREGRAIYRLPTEAEWEYAARGGSLSRGYIYCGSNTLGDIGWYGGNSDNRTHPVGTRQPNELGIFDMTGNVWEWCLDWYGAAYYANSPGENPPGPPSGSSRVLRGGTWYYLEYSCRVAYRDDDWPDLKDFGLGFRLLRTP